MFGQPEFVYNPEPRCPVVLLLDNSTSMSGAPIEELNKGLFKFKEEVERDTLASQRVELSIVSFGPVEHVQDFVTINSYVPKALEPKGSTPMGAAIEYGLDLIRDRKEMYRNNGIQHFTPWMILITDGAPTDSWENASERVMRAEANKELTFFSVGVCNANMDTLKRMSLRPPAMLNGLNFEKFFKWVSDPLKQVSCSRPNSNEMLKLDPIDAWGTIGV